MQPGKINRTTLSPYTAPQTKILFLNANQMTAEKKLELSSYVKRERPLIMAVCEVKPKNSAKKLTEEDYKIEDYVLHHVNLSNEEPGRGIAVYAHLSISKSVTQVYLENNFSGGMPSRNTTERWRYITVCMLLQITDTITVLCRKQ